MKNEGRIDAIGTEELVVACAKATGTCKDKNRKIAELLADRLAEILEYYSSALMDISQEARKPNQNLMSVWARTNSLAHVVVGLKNEIKLVLRQMEKIVG